MYLGYIKIKLKLILTILAPLGSPHIVQTRRTPSFSVPLVIMLIVNNQKFAYLDILSSGSPLGVLRPMPSFPPP